jgi:hypothetical protein
MAVAIVTRILIGSHEPWRTKRYREYEKEGTASWICVCQFHDFEETIDSCPLEAMPPLLFRRPSRSFGIASS